MDTKKINELLNQLVSGPDRSHEAAREIRDLLGDKFPSVLLEKYKKSSSWKQRAWCVYHSIAYARVSRDARALGIEALSDKSRAVRYRACMLLAYSLSNEALPYLKPLLTHKDHHTVSDANAAIDSIIHKNHHYFVDREHSGKVTLTVPEP